MDAFILGAGFSKGVYERMPLISDLTDKFRGKEVFNRWISYGNVEEILSYLSEIYPWNGTPSTYRKLADFHELSVLIADEITKAENAIKDCDKHFEKFRKLFNKWQEQKAPIVTLNYDLIIEKAFRVLKYVNGDCDLYPVTLTHSLSRDGVGLFGSSEKPKSAKIFKLHGSINWYYSGSDKFYGETIFYHQPCEAEARERDSALKDISDKVLLIIPPTFNRSVYFNNETIKTVWRLAYKNLLESSRIFVIGYSLPESDIMMRYLLKSIPANKKIVIVNQDALVF